MLGQESQGLQRDSGSELLRPRQEDWVITYLCRPIANRVERGLAGNLRPHLAVGQARSSQMDEASLSKGGCKGFRPGKVCRILRHRLLRLHDARLVSVLRETKSEVLGGDVVEKSPEFFDDVFNVSISCSNSMPFAPEAQPTRKWGRRFEPPRIASEGRNRAESPGSCFQSQHGIEGVVASSVTRTLDTVAESCSMVAARRSVS